MAHEKRALIQHLFAEMTGVLEDAHATAAEGQAKGAGLARLRTLGGKLTAAAGRVAALAAAVEAVIGPRTPDQAKRRRST